MPTEHRHPLIAGALAGALEAICTYPLEYMKTQLQIAGPHARAAGMIPVGSPSFRGQWDVIQQTTTKHGILGMYRGLSPNLYFSFPKCAIRFAAFEYTSRYLRNDGTFSWSLSSSHSNSTPAGDEDNNNNNRLIAPPTPLTPLQSFTAGLVSGIVEALVVIVPMTTMQVKFITDLNRPVPVYKGFVHGVQSIVAEEGAGGLYRGASPTLLKIALNMSFRFLIYNELNAWLDMQWKKYTQNTTTTTSKALWFLPPDSWRATAVSLAAGAIAGAVTVVGNHPVDVVKSNLQAQVGKPGAPGARYTSALHCAKVVFQSQGVKGLYAGLIPRLNRVVLETSLSFTFYQHFSAMANTYIDGRP